MDYETLTEEEWDALDVDEVWNFLLTYEIATEEELQLVTGINGYSVETLNDVIYYKTAYHDAQQLWDCELKNY